jgi:hypothetical protein
MMARGRSNSIVPGETQQVDLKKYMQLILGDQAIPLEVNACFLCQNWCVAFV